MSNSIEKNEQAFTLLEVVIGLAIGLIFLGAAFKIFIVQQEAYRQQQHLSELHQNIRVAMDMITRETRLAGYNPTGAGLTGIAYSATDTLTMQADLDGDGTTPSSSNEQISYRYYPDPDFQIKRSSNVVTSYQPFVEDIEQFNIKYYNEDGVEITIPPTPGATHADAAAATVDIREIQIEIIGRTSNIDPKIDDYKYGTLTSFITPPNLAY